MAGMVWAKSLGAKSCFLHFLLRDLGHYFLDIVGACTSVQGLVS